MTLKPGRPSALGSKALPDRVTGMVALLAPTLLAVLDVTQAVGGDEEIVLDARLVGLGAAVVAILLRALLLARCQHGGGLAAGRTRPRSS